MNLYCITANGGNEISWQKLPILHRSACLLLHINFRGIILAFVIVKVGDCHTPTFQKAFRFMSVNLTLSVDCVLPFSISYTRLKEMNKALKGNVTFHVYYVYVTSPTVPYVLNRLRILDIHVYIYQTPMTCFASLLYKKAVFQKSVWYLFDQVAIYAKSVLTFKIRRLVAELKLKT